MLTNENIKPAARAALLLLSSAPRSMVHRRSGTVERRMMTTRTLAKKLGVKPGELAGVMHALSYEDRGPAGRGYVERAYTNARESYAAVTWALVDEHEVEALIEALGGPGKKILNFDAIAADVRQWSARVGYGVWVKTEDVAKSASVAPTYDPPPPAPIAKRVRVETMPGVVEPGWCVGCLMDESPLVIIDGETCTRAFHPSKVVRS